MPRCSAKTPALSAVRDPTAATTPEPVSSRSSAKDLAMPPVPMIPQRRGLSVMLRTLRPGLSAKARWKPAHPVGQGGGSRVERRLAVPRRRVPERATPVGAGRIILTEKLVGLGHGGDPSPWFVLSVFATAVQLAGVLALGFRRRWGAKVLAAAFAVSVLLDFTALSGLTTGTVLIKIIVAGLLASMILVRWDDLVA